MELFGSTFLIFSCYVVTRFISIPKIAIMNSNIFQSRHMSESPRIFFFGRIYSFGVLVQPKLLLPVVYYICNKHITYIPSIIIHHHPIHHLRHLKISSITIIHFLNHVYDNRNHHYHHYFCYYY